MAYDGTIKIDTKLDDKGINAGLSSLKKMATKTMAAIGAAAAAGLGAAIKVGMDFESSMSQVAATMGMTAAEIANGSEDYNRLSEAAKQAGESTKYTAAQAGEALNYLALAGYNVDEAISTLPTVLNLAAAGGMDLGYASDLLTDSMSALGLSISDSTRFADEMAKTSQKSNTNIAQLGEAILTVGGTAKQLAGGTVELNTVLGILADNGIKGSEAGTALRQVITNLATPTDKAAGCMKELGLNVYDAEGNIRPLNETFTDLKTILGEMSQEQRNDTLNKIFDARTLKSAEALLANCTNRFDELSNDIKNSSDAAADMAETMNNNLKGKITILGSALEGLGIQIYEGIEDPLKEAADSAIDSVGSITQSIKGGELSSAISNIGSALGNLVSALVSFASSTLPTVINALALLLGNLDVLAAAVIPVVVAFKGFKILKTINSFILAHTAALATDTIATKAAAVAQALLNAVMEANPIGLVIAAITALVAAIGIFVAVSKRSKSAANAEAKAQKERANAIQKARKAQEEANKASEEAMKTSLSECSHLQGLSDELRGLVDANGKVKKGYEQRVNYILGELNSAFGTEYKLVDGVIQKYSELNASIDTYIAKKQLQSIIDAKQGEYDEANKNWKQHVLDEAQTAKELEAAQAKYDKAIETLEKAPNTSNGYAAHYARQDLEAAKKAHEEAREVRDQDIADIQEYNTLVSALASDNTETMQEALANYHSVLKSAEQLRNEHGDSATAEAQKQAENTMLIFSNAQKSFEAGEGTTQAMLNECSSDVKQAVLTFAETGGEIANLIPLFQANGVDIVAALGDGTEQGSKEFYDKLSAVTGKTVDELKELLVPKAQEAGQETNKSFEEGVNQSVSTDEIKSSVEQGVQESNQAAETTAAQNTAGEVMTETIAEGIDNGSDSVGENAANVVENANSAAEEAAGNGGAATGEAITQGTTDGVEQNAETVSDTVTNMVDSAVEEGASTALKGAAEIGKAIDTGAAAGLIVSQKLIETARTKAKDALKAMRSELDIHSPSKAFRDQVGKPIAEGVAVGIDKNGSKIEKSAAAAVDNAIDAAKEAGEIHSPSRITYNDVGVPLVDGISTAIQDHGYEIGEAFENALSDLNLLRDYSIINEAEYYKRLEALRDKHIKKGTEDWHKYTLEIIRYEKKQAENELDILTKRFEKNELTEAEYYDESTKLRELYFTEGTAAWDEFTKTITDNTKARAEKTREAVSDIIKESIDDAYEAAEDAKKSLADTLTDNHYLMETHTYKNAGKNGEDLEFKALRSFDEETKKINELTELFAEFREKASGRNVDWIFDRLAEYDVDEQTEAIRALLNLSEADFEKYLQSAADNKAAKDNYADLFYSDEFDKQFKEQLEGHRDELEEYFGELPDDFFSFGVDCGEEFGVGLSETLFNLFEEIRRSVTEFMASITPQISAGFGGYAATTGSSTYSPTYQIINPSGDANTAIRVAKNRERFDRMRGIQ